MFWHEAMCLCGLCLVGGFLLGLLAASAPRRSRQPIPLALLPDGAWFVDENENLFRAGNWIAEDEPFAVMRVCYDRHESVAEIGLEEIVTPVTDAQEVLDRLFETKCQW